MQKKAGILVLAATLAFGGGTADAGEMRSFSDPGALSACDEDTAARIRFIEQRLEAGRPYARTWWTFFTMFYGTGVIYSFVMGAMKSDSGNRANSFVSGSKAMIGTARLMLSRQTARDGAVPMQGLGVETAEQCAEVLAVGEDLLRRTAKESASRYSWTRHAANVGLNVIGALIVAEGYGEERKGWTNAAIGIAVGEIFTWSKPWNGTRDLADYEEKFGRAKKPVAWSVSPTIGGLRVSARF